MKHFVLIERIPFQISTFVILNDSRFKAARCLLEELLLSIQTFMWNVEY